MARNKYDVDEVVEQKFDIKQLKRLVDYIRPYKGKMFFVLVLMLSSSGLGMFLIKFLQIEMDKYIPDKDIKAIVILTVLAGIIVLYSVISTRIKIDVTTKVGQDIIHTIREDIFKHLQELPFSYYDESKYYSNLFEIINLIYLYPRLN